MNAKQRRAEAMNMLAELYYPTSQGYAHTGATAEQMAGNITKLAVLGRTPRWVLAIDAWATRVREATDQHGLDHAFFQGAVHAGHAAE